MANVTINENTKIPLFVVIGSIVILIPSLITVCFWLAELKSDAKTANADNTKQESQIKELNDKLEVVYEIRTDLKAIKTVLKIKEDVKLRSSDATQTN